MSKIRVYELARELKVESKLLVNKLKDLGIEVSSHQSTLSADQVVRIKREMTGESPASKAPRPSPSVIRRRKPDEQLAGGEHSDEDAPSSAAAEEEESEALHSDQDESPAPSVAVAEEKSRTPIEEPAPAPVAVRRTAAAEPSAPAKAKVPESEKTEEIRVQASEPVHERVAPASAEPEKPTAAPARVESVKTTSASPVSESRSMPRPQESHDSAKIVRREPPPPPAPAVGMRPPGGATIVRRASPEEQEQRQIRPSPIMRVGAGGGPIRRDGPGSGPGGPRPRDDGGPRPSHDRGGPRIGSGSGGGEMLFRKPPDLDVGVGLTDTPARRWEDPSKSKDRDKKRTSAQEAEEAAKKVPPKQKRDQVTMRTLLNQVDSLEEDLTEELEPVEPVVVDPRTIKKVYTPQTPARKKDLKRRKDLKKTQVTTPRASYRVVKMGHDVTVGELAKQLAVKSSELIKKLMTQGIMATINQSIDFDTATLIANEYGFEVKSNLVSIEDILSDKRKAHDNAEMVERPPIVTIMGHVDHGKTSILDAIRKAKVAASEAGGITQHIGAYTVEKDGRHIAFLDTPGHEAFSSMRSRGAKATDIVVLVVAADDGVMPQTVEAISHARAANVPIIVAINKIDKPNKNLDRINSELAEHGIQSEDWGGENQFVQVSALKGIGIEELLEAILLQAEVLELKTPLDVPASGVVVEAHLDRGRGPVATIMVQKGVLKVGDFVVAGTALGRVRAMNDHTGKRLKEAGPSTPVEVIGLASVPMAGDSLDAVEDEKTAKEVADWRSDAEMRSAQGRSSAATLDQLLAKVKNADTPEVPVIIKADTQGSVEAISEALVKLNTDRVRNRIVHKAVGGINESDISLATTSGAVIVGFNVRAARGLDDMADKQGTLIKYFSVIYDIVDTLKSIMAGKLPPVQKEVIQGHAEVRQTIKVPKIGLIAGTSILDGKVTRGAQLRLIRDNVVIFAGRVGSLRRFKDDVKEVMQGYECGIGIDGFSDIREGDVIETFVIEETAAAL